MSTREEDDNECSDFAPVALSEVRDFGPSRRMSQGAEAVIVIGAAMLIHLFRAATSAAE